MSDADLIEKFKKADKSKYPDFERYEKPLEMGLWVLWVTKEELEVEKLTGGQIASILIKAQEVSCDPLSVKRAFSRAGGKVHPHKENEENHYEIMGAGKKHLMSLVEEGMMKVFQFWPGTKYSSKRDLSKNILGKLKGDLKIVDPYCGERTLDILSDLSDRKVEFLTRLDNLDERKKRRLTREIQDFKSDTSNPNVEFRDYPNTEIHDRYIISSDSLVLLGHSLKDLGNKESFAVILDSGACANVVQELTSAFQRRWNSASPI